MRRRHRRQAARVHRSPVALVRLPRRGRWRELKSLSVTVSDAGDGAGTWVAEVQPQVASAGATVEAAPVSIAPGGTAVMQITARRGGRRRPGGQLRVHPPPARERRAPDPVRVLGLALVAHRRAGAGAEADPVRRHAHGRGSRAGVQVADLAVLDPRHLRRRSVGERRRQGEDLLAEHREAGGQRRGRRREARDEAGRADHRASRARTSPSTPGSWARSTRTTCSATPASP